MRHRKKGRKLGTDASHTKAMKKSLVCSLLANDRIKTIEARAKEIRPDVDRIITWAKRGDVHSRRLAIAAIGDKEVVREVFEKAAQGMWADRNGGYTRIYKLGNRTGDNAPMVIIEMVTEPVAPKADASAPAAKKTTAKKAVAKKAESVEEVVEAEAEETGEPDVAKAEAAEAEAAVEEAAKEADEKPAEAEKPAADADKADEKPAEEAAKAEKPAADADKAADSEKAEDAE